MKNKILLFIPTYNEKENVELLFSKIMEQNLKIDILFMDDNSPDGTGTILEKLKKKHRNLNVIHRAGKLGIGSAHKDGLKYAYSGGYDLFISMDSDFTHPPEYINELIKHSKTNDIVIGSRYLEKKSLEDWNLMRKMLTITGHLLTKYLLKINYDATGAFRLYNLRAISSEAFTLVSSNGYSFFYESLFILNLNKYSIFEIPIKLPARTYGHSKMRMSDAFQSFKYLFSIFLNACINREKYLVDRMNVPRPGGKSKISDPQDWDSYWKTGKSSSGLIYDAIAAFYRKCIIKKTLNFFVRRYFRKGSKILHAGCGSGQVDVDIRDYISITALDISPNALSFYRKIHGAACKIRQGSIFKTGLPKNSYDGIYNLGVMEHFTEAEIEKILSEFRRILKVDGRLIIFWPPEFGLSVVFLKFLKWIIEKFSSRKNIKFHPDEITRIKSKKHAIEIFEKAGFRIVTYYFGMKDLFTYTVIVAENPGK